MSSCAARLRVSQSGRPCPPASTSGTQYDLCRPTVRNPDRPCLACRQRRDFIRRQITFAAKVLPSVPCVRAGGIPNQPVIAARSTRRHPSRSLSTRSRPTGKPSSNEKPTVEDRISNQASDLDGPPRTAASSRFGQAAQADSESSGNPRVVDCVERAKLLRRGSQPYLAAAAAIREQDSDQTEDNGRSKIAHDDLVIKLECRMKCF